jgi:hypothetical protein
MNRVTTALLLVATLTTAAFAKAAPSAKADMMKVEEAPTYDRATVRAMLAEIRAHNLAAFHAYATAGVYPSNVYKPGALNVWRDQDGHFCAAATIIRASGEIELTDRVAEQTNFIRLADVTSGPLMDWMLTSGLTQEELVAIQKPFMPVVDKPVPAPVQTVTLDAKLRAAETTRLRKVYAQVERQLAKSEKQSLDTATDRLMKHPALIEKLAEADARLEVDGAPRS